jgi:hypothetical protein
MLDTIWLKSEEYALKSGKSVEIQQGKSNTGTGEVTGEFPLITDGSGKTYWGNKIYHNFPFFAMDIRALGNVPRLSVKLSVPKYYNRGENYRGINAETTKEVFRAVEKELAEFGILTNFNEMKLSRVDTATNIDTDEKFFKYAPIFSALNCVRKHKQQYHNGYLYLNGVSQICIYDKIQEMKDNPDTKKKKIDVSMFPENVIRFENRLISRKKIESVFGFDNLKGLLSYYDNLQDHYRETISKDIFRYEPDEITALSSKALYPIFEYYADNYKSWLYRFQKEFGFIHIIQNIGKEIFLDEYRNFEQERYGKKIQEEIRNGGIKRIYKPGDKNKFQIRLRVQVSRIRKELEKAGIISEMIQGKKVNLSELYRELKTKFLRKAS